MLETIIIVLFVYFCVIFIGWPLIQDRRKASQDTFSDTDDNSMLKEQHEQLELAIQELDQDFHKGNIDRLSYEKARSELAQKADALLDQMIRRE